MFSDYFNTVLSQLPVVVGPFSPLYIYNRMPSFELVDKTGPFILGNNEADWGAKMSMSVFGVQAPSPGAAQSGYNEIILHVILKSTWHVLFISVCFWLMGVAFSKYNFVFLIPHNIYVADRWNDKKRYEQRCINSCFPLLRPPFSSLPSGSRSFLSFALFSHPYLYVVFLNRGIQEYRGR